MGTLLLLLAATRAQEGLQVADLVQRLDTDMNGYITRDEMLRNLREYHFDRYRREYEKRADGLDEFWEPGHPVQHIIDKHDDQLHNDHHMPMVDDMDPRMDTNGDGRLSVHELMKHVGLPESVEKMMENDIDRLLAAVDSDSDGAVSHTEAFEHHRPMLHLVSHDSHAQPFPHPHGTQRGELR